MTPGTTHAGVIAWFAKNHVAANLLMAAVVVVVSIANPTAKTLKAILAPTSLLLRQLLIRMIR